MPSSGNALDVPQLHAVVSSLAKGRSPMMVASRLHLAQSLVESVGTHYGWPNLGVLATNARRLAELANKPALQASPPGSHPMGIAEDLAVVELPEVPPVALPDPARWTSLSDVDRVAVRQWAIARGLISVRSRGIVHRDHVAAWRAAGSPPYAAPAPVAEVVLDAEPVEPEPEPEAEPVPDAEAEPDATPEAMAPLVLDDLAAECRATGDADLIDGAEWLTRKAYQLAGMLGEWRRLAPARDEIKRCEDALAEARAAYEALAAAGVAS